MNPDEQLQRFVVTHRVEFLDHVFVALSKLGTLGFVWVALALVAAVLWRRPQIVFLVTAGVAAADLLATGLKFLTARPRPYVRDPEPPPLLSTPLDLSLPSGHAATSFAGATLLMWFLPRRLAPGLYLLAALVAFSRVYVGVHYPGDIVLGAALGIAVATALRLLVRAPQQSPRAPRPG